MVTSLIKYSGLFVYSFCVVLGLCCHLTLFLENTYLLYIEIFLFISRFKYRHYSIVGCRLLIVCFQILVLTSVVLKAYLHWLAREACVLCTQRPCLLVAWNQPDGNIYKTETGKCYKARFPTSPFRKPVVKHLLAQHWP